VIGPHPGGISDGRDSPVGMRRSYTGFEEADESGLHLPLHKNPANSQAALTRTPERFKVVSEGGVPHLARGPFLFQEGSRRYLVTPRLSWRDQIHVDPSEIGGVSMERPGIAFAAAPRTVDALSSLEVLRNRDPQVILGPDTHGASVFGSKTNTKYGFHALYHPYAAKLVSYFSREGLERTLRREIQRQPDRWLNANTFAPPFDFDGLYGASPDLVAKPHPDENLDFSFAGAYSSYNWELFFHAPMLIADRLAKNQHFEDALRWYHYVFNPTDTSDHPKPARYWQMKEFFEKSSLDYQQARLSSMFNLLARGRELREKDDLTAGEQQDLRRLEDFEAAITAWRSQPFKPHLVARTRTTAYQKTVVMKYIDTLIAWGDQLFRRDTLETLNEATQIYALAANILGRRPVELPPSKTPRVETFNSLSPRLDAFSNALAEVEDFVPVPASVTSGTESAEPPPPMLFFCLPKNDKLLGSWDTVADRLFKIRHCMNIEGVVRQLPLFEPPIDPALLVRATAAGIDLSKLLTEAAAPALAYRFGAVTQKASELAAEVRGLGAMLLAILEKRDAEALSLLRARHELAVLDMVDTVRERQLDEATEQMNALLASRHVVLGRLGHYQRLLGESNPKVPPIGEPLPDRDRPRFSEIQNLVGFKMFPHEILENVLLTAGQALEGQSAVLNTLGVVLHAIPQVYATPMGVGTSAPQFGRIVEAAAAAAGSLAREMQFGAGLSGRLGSSIARELEWVLQHNQAARELAQLDKQILAAEIRREIAGHELRTHRRQMEQARETDAFMRDKYTNQDLYAWMLGQISGVYFQAYQLAYETAKRAEHAYCHELGVATPNIVKFGYWDNLKKGLLAGEKLHHDLKRLEVSYLERNTRELELTKHVSLVSLAPNAFLKLKTDGSCTFEIPEWLFDLDTPGHYRRRLKMVGVTIPSVTGPYTSVHCTLRLLSSQWRQLDTVNSEKPYPFQSPSDDRFIMDWQVRNVMVTSTGQNDSGLFEPSLRDERFLPFEGAGAISRWSLQLPMDFKTFDYSTISDVILHLRYTAKEGDSLREPAIGHVKALIGATGSVTLSRLVSLRHEFPSEWHRFVTAPSAPVAAMTVDIASSRFPYFVQSQPITIVGAEVASVPPLTQGQLGITPGSHPGDPFVNAWIGEAQPGPWTIATSADQKSLKDLFVVLHYRTT
jgi:hypothetical protein